MIMNDKDAKNDTKILNAVRPGIVDVWNAFMLDDATYAEHDIPNCPTTANKIPSQLISWSKAKQLHKRFISSNKNYHINAFIHFYIDDSKFDGKRNSIWLYPKNALEIIKHFDGIITPDFSTNQDFPEPVKIIATYRMRTFGYWILKNGIQVINNVRWGTEETWEYCFAGVDTHSIIAIGAVASGLRKSENKELFFDGFSKMLDVLNPTTIIVYGSMGGNCFDLAEAHGVECIFIPSERSLSFKGKELVYEQS